MLFRSDLFGGGGAISFEFLQRKQIKKVVYNELNTGVCELLKKIQKDGVTKDFYKWVSREEFNSHKNDDDWYGGLLKTCWSFGNNQRDYLFAKDLEEDKRLLHEIIVNRCDTSRQLFKDKFDLFIDDFYLKNDDIKFRRLDVMQVVRAQIGRFDLQQLEQLQRLEQLEQLEQLEISNLSYEQVKIETHINETIVYCDPPYKETGKYQKDINHDKFLEFVKNSPYKIYISSYDFDLPCVFELSHRSSLSATNNGKKVVEKLFCNQEEKTKGSLF